MNETSYGLQDVDRTAQTEDSKKYNQWIEVKSTIEMSLNGWCSKISKIIFNYLRLNKMCKNIIKQGAL